MEVIKSITIETFIKPMKNKNISYGIAESDGRKLEIDLDNLYITFGNNHFDLASIPGTKGGNRYFFLCPICGNRCRKLYKRLLLYVCGSCQKIHRSTLNRSKTDCQYYWELALKEARKVEPGWSPRRGGYMFDGFPERPRYMKRDRYHKHYKKFLKYIEKGIDFG